MSIQAILFDLDGTLGNTLPVVVQALQETFIRFAGREYTPAEITEMFGPTEEGVISRRVPEEVFPAALRFYLDRYAALHESARLPFPGVYRLLQLLVERGIHRGVVTGKGPGTAEISMRAMGLSPYIEVLVPGSDNGAEKPQAIRGLLDAWRIDPGSAAYVGDMPYDMRAAAEAGVLPLAAAWAHTATVRPGDGARVFYTVDELTEWVMKETETNPPGQTAN